MATKNTKATKTARLLKFLQAGNNITPGQAQERFGIKNISAIANSLRQQGYAVYCNSGKTKVSGSPLKSYRIGTPTRAVVAAGYRALAAEKQELRQITSFYASM